MLLFDFVHVFLVNRMFSAPVNPEKKTGSVSLFVVGSWNRDIILITKSQVFVDDCFREHDAQCLTLIVLQSIKMSCLTGRDSDSITGLKTRIHSKWFIMPSSLLLHQSLIAR